MNIWPTKKLGEVAEINPKKLELNSISDSTEVSFIPMQAVDDASGTIVSPEVRKLSEVKKGYTYFKENDVLFAKITPCMQNGKFAVAKKLVNDIGFGSTEFYVIRPSEQILPEWIYLLIRQKSFRKEAGRHMTGTAGQQRVPKEYLENIEIPVPPIGEQKRIVAKLEKILSKISEAQILRQKTVSISASLFASILHQVFSGSEQKEWEVKRIGEVCELYQGLAINAKTKHLLVNKSNLPLLRIKDLRDNTEEQYVSQTGYPKDTLVSEKDIIYTRTGQIGLVFRGRRGILHNNSFKIVPSSPLSRNYLFWFLHEPSFKKKIIDISSGIAQSDVTHKNFKEQIITFPSLGKQEKIVAYLDDLNGKVQALQKLQKSQLAELSALQQSVLHQAFKDD